MNDLEYRVIFLESVVSNILEQFYGADYEKMYKDSLKKIGKQDKNGKYCETIEKSIGNYVIYPSFGDHYISYNIDENVFVLWDNQDNSSSDIKYCPWCGRKLEVPEEKLRDKIAILRQEGYDEMAKAQQELRRQLTGVVRIIMERQRVDMKRGLTQGEKEMYYEQLGEIMGLL